MTYNSKKEKVAKLFLKTKDRKVMAGLLEDVLTPQEIETIAERIDIFESLLHKEPQRQMAQRLGSSIATITRGSRVLQYGTGTIKKLLGES